MKLSLVFELLLIFVLLAFAASKNIRKQKNDKKAVQNRNDSDKLEDNSINKYCKCSESHCNCCRDFAVPVVNLNGPGCASLMYLSGDKMSVSLSFGKKVITNRTLSSRKPSPVCLPLPGGLSKFCGRVYNIARAGEEFRACLGLELQSKSAVEAAVRVSCFKFGPRGVTTEPADPLPLVPQNEKIEDDDDDDDDEDDFGLGSDDDDDDDDEDDDDDDGELDAVNDIDSADYTGFSLLGEDLLGDLFGSSGGKKANKNKKKQAPAPTPTTTTTTRRPRPSRRPSRKPSTKNTTPKPLRTTTLKIRPVNRRPTRKPSKRRRPTRRPPTSITAESQSATTPTTTTITTPAPLVTIPVVTPSSTAATVAPSTERLLIEVDTDQTFEPIIGLNQNVEHLFATTAKSVTNFEDPGLEMSLAHITGQLSGMPVTPILSNTANESEMPSTNSEEINFEKIETITPKMPTTMSFSTTTDEKLNDNMIQIVHDLDQSDESVTPESMKGEESRGQDEYSASSDNSGADLPRKKHRSSFDFDDLDVLHLSEIGETVGEELGVFGRNRRPNKNPNHHKVRGGKKDDDYSDILGLDDLDSLLRKSMRDHKNRRRQNKMMRGQWGHV
ncbi:histone-lysine N-methyltransferase SETD1A [Ostrinia furnacalis]|uniref:histone-lysine N-methyltransferase SETD1A n=1 Tax=Ostrinia furnacalis TaxID=93504 RepID=UPI0010400677|nr:histone-lysine N-methyltransferase SETD1A [Ostrinia furnacalis]